MPPERIGFADVVVDADGKLRRSILASPTWEGDVKYSLALRLAQIHLAAHGVPFQHSDRTSDPLQFGKTRLPRFQPNSGGYIRADANGNQLILNFCGSQETVRALSRLVKAEQSLLQRLNLNVDFSQVENQLRNQALSTIGLGFTKHHSGLPDGEVRTR
ncbi:MAG: CHASE2 domain-containing protein [Leptolyngbyaceae cyanobacterium CSU_1_3]|nr:CHASE2 domain-containing protein [Leptolyngbyaceae cyanobacterium CSU_1_3]